MLVKEIMEQRKLTKRELSVLSGIPYSTLSDIVNEKADITKSSADTVYCLSKALGITMEELLAEHLEKRCDFELFKSNVCHRLKESGDIEYMIEILENDEIGIYYKRKWYPEAFYMLGMLDYLSRVNKIPVCTDYNDLRKQKLDKIIYPQSVRLMAAIKNSKEPLEQAKKEAIPEFLNYNIVEGDVRNVE